MRFETLAVHAGGESDAETGSLAPPIHLSTTFEHGPAGERRAGYEYQRERGPTQDRLERAMTLLEAGTATLTFASGMAAMSALLESLPSGVHVLIPLDCYGGLRALASEVLVEKGITVTAVDTTDLGAVRAAITKKTRCLWVESPTNPLLEVSDLEALSALAHAHDMLVFCDNTFATPALQRPLLLGVDVVMHSTTKYIGGHHDALGGALVFARRDAFYETVARRRLGTGGVHAPFSSWLTLRGLRTLSVRMTMCSASAGRIATFLAAHPAVRRTRYPGLESDRGHAIARRQMRDYGGMVTFALRDGRDAAVRVASRVGLIVNATSLGGTETTIEHRASIEGPSTQTPVDLLRLSVGLEHPDDLIDDLRHALD